MNKPGIFETVKNSYCFLSDYKFHAFKIFLYLFPVFLIIHAFYFWGALEMQLYKGAPELQLLAMYRTIALPFFILSILSVPVYSAMIIAWHRAYLLGPSDRNRVNPLRMTREEWQFMGKYILYGCLCVVAMFAAGAVIGGLGIFLVRLLHVQTTGLAIFLLVIFLIGAFLAVFSAVLRCSFYFPAKAVGEYLSFRQSYHASKGLGFRLLVTNVVAWLPLIVFNVIYMQIVPPLQLSPLAVNALGVSLWSAPVITSFILQLPSGLLAGCMIMFVTVNNVSQYYRWLEENRLSPVSPHDLETVSPGTAFPTGL